MVVGKVNIYLFKAPTCTVSVSRLHHLCNDVNHFTYQAWALLYDVLLVWKIHIKIYTFKVNVNVTFLRLNIFLGFLSLQIYLLYSLSLLLGSNA